MSIGKDGWACTMLAEHIQHTFYAATFLAASVQLAVGVGSCTALAETVVRFGVNGVSAGNVRKVDFARANILSALHNNGTQPAFYEFQCRKEPALHPRQ